MMTLKTLAGALGSGVLVLGLAGCGSDDGGDAAGYCDTIADLEGKSLSELDPTNSDDVAEVAEVVSDIANEAPDGVKADWDVLTGFLADLANDPLDVDQNQATKVEEAMANIEKQVKSGCDIEL